MTRRSGLRRLAIVAAVALSAAGGAVFPSQAGGGTLRPLRLDVTGWKRAALPLPSASDGIGPGSYLLIDQPDGTFICSANFVWRDGAGTTYLGAAGHCFLPAGETSAFGTDRFVSRVQVCVASCAFGGQLGASLNGAFVDLGPVVYARQHADGDPADQIGNDFGLVTVPEGLVAQLRPSVPVFGGPTGVRDGDRGTVCLFGNAVGVAETFLTKGRIGQLDPAFHDQIDSVDAGDDGWAAGLLSYGGDSGAAVNFCSVGLTGAKGGDGLGILTHGLAIGPLPLPIAAGTTVGEARAMVRADLGLDVRVVSAAGTPIPSGV